MKAECGDDLLTLSNNTTYKSGGYASIYPQFVPLTYLCGRRGLWILLPPFYLAFSLSVFQLSSPHLLSRLSLVGLPRATATSYMPHLPPLSQCCFPWFCRLWSRRYFWLPTVEGNHRTAQQETTKPTWWMPQFLYLARQYPMLSLLRHTIPYQKYSQPINIDNFYALHISFQLEPMCHHDIGDHHDTMEKWAKFGGERVVLHSKRGGRKMR